MVGRLLPDLARPPGAAPTWRHAAGGTGDGRARSALPIPGTGGRRADLHIHSLASDGTSGRRDPRPARARGPSSTSSRSPTMSGSTPRVAARTIAAIAGPGRGHRRRGGHDARRTPARRCSSTDRSAVRLAAPPDRRDPRPGWPGHPGPPTRARIRCARRGPSCGALSATRIRAAARRASRRSTRRPSDALAPPGRRVRCRARPGQHRRQRCPRAPRTSGAAGRRSRAAPRRSCDRRSWTTDRASRHVPRHGRPGRHLHEAAPQVQSRRARGARRPAPARWHGSRPGYPGGTRRPAVFDREAARR